MYVPVLLTDAFEGKYRCCITFILAFVMIFSAFPADRASGAPSQRATSDYGIYSEMNEVMEEIAENRDSPDILSVTEGRLEAELDTTDYSTTDPSVDFDTVEVQPQDPYERIPTIFGDMEHYQNLYGKETILEFLMDRGLSNYYIYTRFNGEYKFTRDFWRPMLIYPMDIENGASIDIDDDPATGNVNGDEVYLSLRPTISIAKLPTIFPFNRTLVLNIGLRMDFRRLAPIEGDLSVQVVKYVSYQNKNYIVNVGTDFSEDIPSEMMVELHTEKVNFELNPGEKILDFINNYVIGNRTNMEDTVLLSSIQGPYIVHYSLPTNSSDYVNDIAVSVGLTEILEGTKNKISWVMMDLSSASRQEHIPITGRIKLDSPGIMSPMDYLQWEGSDGGGNSQKCDADLYYYDEAELLTYAEASMVDVPGRFNISIDYSKTVNGTNVTPLEYRANDRIEYVNYRHSQFMGDVDGDYSAMGFSVDDIPESFNVEITTDINRDIAPILTTNSTMPVLTRVLDSVIGHVIERFTRIGRVIGGMADGVMDLPAKNGWMNLEAGGGDHFGTWEFFRSSSEYLVPASGNPFDFIAFLNSTDSRTDGGGTDDPGLGPISGRITGLNRLNMNFSHHTLLEADLPGRDPASPFRMLFRDDDTYFHSELSNLPRSFRVEVVDNEISVKMGKGVGPTQRIGEMSAVYFDGKNYVSVRMKDVAREIYYKELGGAMEVFSTVPFGSVEFYLSNDTTLPFKIMEGNYVHLHQDRSSVVISGRVHSLKHIRYKPGEAGNFLMEYENETTFKAYLYNYVGGGSEAKVVIDPLPSNFSFDLPGAVGDVDFRLPDIVNITGNLDLSSLVTSAASVVDSVVYLASGLTEAFLENIGGISQKVSFAYDLQEGETLDILGYFRKGDTSDLKPVHWTHGISLSQNRNTKSVGREGKLYLQGMPKKGEISTNITGDDIRVTLSFDNWRPENHWLLIESFGIQDRDAIIYMNGLKTNIDFHLDVNLTTNMSIGGNIAGEIVLEGSSNPGQFYVHLVKYDVTTSSTDVLLSSVPTSLRIGMEVQRQISFRYSASSAIKYIYLSNSRLVDGRWYHVNGLLHDVPEEMEFTLRPDTDFDPGQSPLLRGLPHLYLTTDSDEGNLDAYFDVEGRTVGQVGKVELFIEDVRSITAGPVKGSSGYSIESTGMGYFSLEVRDLPLMEAFTVDSIRCYGEDIEKIELDLDMFFGVYPVFELSGIRTKSFHFSVNGVIKILSKDFSTTLSLFNVTLADISTSAELYNDRVAVGSKSESNIIIPAPILTLWNTLL